MSAGISKRLDFVGRESSAIYHAIGGVIGETPPGVGTALTLEDGATALTLEDGATALVLEDA